MDIISGFSKVVSQGSQELYLRVRRSGPETTIGAEILVRIGITCSDCSYRST